MLKIVINIFSYSPSPYLILLVSLSPPTIYCDVMLTLNNTIVAIYNKEIFKSFPNDPSL